jgi:CDGSH-type Zn-finger protein/uncharacterized Fe-S cluster protein YjdI
MSDDQSTNKSTSPLTKFPGAELDVTWDSRLCTKQAECVRADGELFVSGRKPWCQPDLGGQGDAVREVASRCPSGALVVLRKTGDQVEHSSPPTNQVFVAPNGPFFVTGQLEIQGAAEDMLGVKRRAALCRCGHSKNKPFCDGSHLDAEFRDSGAVGRVGGASAEDSGGPLAVKPATDGPLRLAGPFEIIAASGRRAFSGNTAALCRCGASKVKPFCDGSHKTIGFRAD